MSKRLDMWGPGEGSVFTRWLCHKVSLTFREAVWHTDTQHTWGYSASSFKLDYFDGSWSAMWVLENTRQSSCFASGCYAWQQVCSFSTPAHFFVVKSFLSHFLVWFINVSRLKWWTVPITVFQSPAWPVQSAYFIHLTLPVYIETMNTSKHSLLSGFYS